MPYDPQRSHRRPRLTDDAPAPIDALLGNGAEPEPPTSHAQPDAGSSVDAPAVVEPEAPAPDRDERAVVPTPVPDVEVAAPSERGRPRVAALAIAALLFVVLVLAWVRRRR
jgi:hypothetical protein